MNAPDRESRTETIAERLLDRLREISGPNGFIPFDRFMDVALYSEGLGYYTRTRAPFGPEGDFYTAARFPLFAETIAERVRAVRQALGFSSGDSLVEIGPGDGLLASRILGALARDRPSSPLEVVLVERSPTLRARALERVRAVAPDAGVRVRAVPSISTIGPFSGVVVANELLDAMPARRLKWNGSEWLELGVRVTAGRIVPADGPPAIVVPPPALPNTVPPSTIVELSPTAEGIVREVADHLVEGLFVVIDYGMEESELLTAHPGGTITAVRRHRWLPDPLERPGESDLSVFVNFTRIRAAARAAGLTEIEFEGQSEALGAWGFPRLLEATLERGRTPEEEVRTRLLAKNLLLGFERFRVLELAPPGSAGRLAAPTSPDASGSPRPFPRPSPR